MSIYDFLIASIVTSTKLFAIFAIPIVILTLLHRCLIFAVGGHSGRRWQLASGIFCGVPHHEIAHILGVLLFGFQLQSFSLWQPDPQSRTLGYVSYKYNQGSIFNLFGTAVVGVAPLIAGILSVHFIVTYLIGHGPVWFSFVAPWDSQYWTLAPIEQLLERIVGQEGWLNWLLLWIAVSIGMHCCPSKADIMPGVRAYFGLIILLFLAHFFLSVFGNIDGRIIGGLFPFLSPYVIQAAQMLTTVVVISTVGTIPFAIIALITRRIGVLFTGINRLT